MCFGGLRLYLSRLGRRRPTPARGASENPADVKVHHTQTLPPGVPVEDRDVVETSDAKATRDASEGDSVHTRYAFRRQSAGDKSQAGVTTDMFETLSITDGGGKNPPHGCMRQFKTYLTIVLS